MNRSFALPFTIRRDDSVVGEEITSTVEKVHGLLRLEGDELTIQWRTSRAVSRVGKVIRTDHEMGAVREAVLPLSAIAGARVRWVWWYWPPGRYLVLTAADLGAFEEVAGASGLRMPHPAELVVHIKRSHQTDAREFVSELELALAERALRAAEEPARIEADREDPRHLPGDEAPLDRESG